MIHLDSPDVKDPKGTKLEASNKGKGMPPAAISTARASLKGDKIKGTGGGAKNTSMGSRAGTSTLGVKGGGIIKGVANHTLKHVMIKGKLPAFNFDSRSIFNKQVNRNTSRNAHTAKPAPPASSSTAAAHATSVNKENRTANASIPAVSSAKGMRTSTSNIPSAATAAMSKSAAVSVTGSYVAISRAGSCIPSLSSRRQSVREGKEAVGPKAAIVTELPVAQSAQAHASHTSGRKRQSSEEVFLPAGLKCFVT
eukprot:CAMPEP_0173098968 /NCGR_PEP_ID=MMETSP1102-20130122/35150_1 /TAXON_ID=49646 /ORGANISM="Geminigera sp., Strain Caron Lab Isolate" /LENGTH=252 /DNA_ID=CAMNT_0013991773 /DNA_START=13 /DNA_END=771 /DNA_ORIENTATION=+